MRTNINYSIVSHHNLITLVTFKYLLEDLEFLLSNLSKIKLKSQTIMILSFTLHRWISISFSTVAWKCTENYVFQLHSWNTIFSIIIIIIILNRLHLSTVKSRERKNAIILAWKQTSKQKYSVIFWLNFLLEFYSSWACPEWHLPHSGATINLIWFSHTYQVYFKVLSATMLQQHIQHFWRIQMGFDTIQTNKVLNIQ